MLFKTLLSIIIILLFPFSSFAEENSHSRIIPLESEEGREYLLNTGIQSQYLHLSEQYTTQINQTFCGIASSVMVLNALHIAPSELLFKQYSYINQDNFFSEAINKTLPKKHILAHGLTLDQLGDLLKHYPIKIELHHASKGSEIDFNSALENMTLHSSLYIIANFSREVLGQAGEGHFSPLAAYDKRTHSVLILDVARYKYTAYWVNEHVLWQAMNTKDGANGLERGYLILSSLNRYQNFVYTY